jgi:hypothetical protein
MKTFYLLLFTVCIGTCLIAQDSANAVEATNKFEVNDIAQCRQAMRSIKILVEDYRDFMRDWNGTDDYSEAKELYSTARQKMGYLIEGLSDVARNSSDRTTLEAVRTQVTDLENSANALRQFYKEKYKNHNQIKGGNVNLDVITLGFNFVKGVWEFFDERRRKRRVEIAAQLETYMIDTWDEKSNSGKPSTRPTTNEAKQDTTKPSSSKPKDEKKRGD